MHQWHIIGKEIEGRPWRQPFPGPENKHRTSPKCQSVAFLLTLAAWEFFLLLSSRGKELVFSYFFLNLAAPRGMQDLSTLTQDGTHTLALKLPCPNHRPPGKPQDFFFFGGPEGEEAASQTVRSWWRQFGKWRYSGTWWLVGMSLLNPQEPVGGQSSLV